MKKFISTKKETCSPAWSERNQRIGSLISQNCKILDLGCGENDLLNYISPSKYVGIDCNSKSADIQLNFNETFFLPTDDWDYIVCSGLLEYISDIEIFFNTIKNSSKKYIFTFWKKNKNIREKNGLLGISIIEFEKLIEKNYKILNQSAWRSHVIYVCQDAS